MENQFLEIRLSLLEGFILNTSEKKENYLFMINNLIAQIASDLPSSQHLLPTLELYRSNIAKLQPEA